MPGLKNVLGGLGYVIEEELGEHLDALATLAGTGPLLVKRLGGEREHELLNSAAQSSDLCSDRVGWCLPAVVVLEKSSAIPVFRPQVCEIQR
ncbi:MAG: hypothetical protein M3065_01590 [Actinomycetota bacterium]|nr:hypothetical protein [Actinomycetota bacterium]